VGKAKEMIVAPIEGRDAFRFIREHHYSHKVVSNSQVHFGAHLNGKLLGVMQFGPPMDRRKSAALVKNTPLRGMLELNRMAFAEELPRNSESRALGIVLRLMRKELPAIRWVISFADATQCGDGTIYRAAGFTLTAVRKNQTIIKMPDGSIAAKHGLAGAWQRAGTPLPGFQVRYIYFLDPSAREDLTVEALPYSALKEMGASMYRGERAGSIEVDAPAVQAGEGGSIPTPALHPQGAVIGHPRVEEE